MGVSFKILLEDLGDGVKRAQTLRICETVARNLRPSQLQTLYPTAVLELTPIQRVCEERPLVSGSECKGELALVMVYL